MKAIILLLITLRMQYVVCSQFYIVVSSDTPCPSRLPCLSLQQFISNSTLSSANATLELESGNHILDTNFEISGGTYFTMAATVNASITCRFSNSIRVQRVQQVKINGTTFSGCEMFEVSHALSAVIVRSHFYNSNGVYALKISSESALVESCKFLNNTGGPALYVNGGSAMILNSTFSNNNISGRGTVFASGSLHVSQSNFINNTAEYGGAIYCAHGTLITEHCNFYHNVAIKSGGALYGRQSIQIFGSIFVDNRATSRHGGVVYVVTNYPSAIASGNSFLNNKANESGGVLYLVGNYPKLNSNGNSFVNNQAIHGSGGAFYLSGNYPFLNTSGNSFISNKANVNGGAMSVSGNYPSQNASGNSFIDNKANNRGDDLYMSGNFVSLNASGNSFIGINVSRSDPGGTWYLSGNYVTSNESGNSFISNISYGIESLDLTLTICTSDNITQSYNNTTTSISTHTLPETTTAKTEYNSTLLETTTAKPEYNSTLLETTTAKPEYNSPGFQTVEPHGQSESDLPELQNKAREVSIIMYTFVAISIILAALIVLVLLVKLYGVIKHKQRKEPSQQSNRLPSDASTQARPYEEIPWRGHLVDTNTIQMMPNIVYKTHCK